LLLDLIKDEIEKHGDLGDHHIQQIESEGEEDEEDPEIKKMFTQFRRSHIYESNT
jgi:hypothetical protein